MKEKQLLVLHNDCPAINTSFNTTNIPCRSSCGLVLQLLLVSVSIPSVAYCLEMIYHIFSVVIQHLPSPPNKWQNSVFHKIINLTNQIHCTLVIVRAFTLPVCLTCGPIHRSIRGPHLSHVSTMSAHQSTYNTNLYTVVVGVLTRSLRIRSLNLLY